MIYIETTRDTSDGTDYDEKCYYGIIYCENDTIKIHKVFFGKKIALREYKDIAVENVMDKNKTNVVDIVCPSRGYSIVKITNELGCEYYYLKKNKIAVFIPVKLCMSQFGELYGDIDNESYQKIKSQAYVEMSTNLLKQKKSGTHD